MKIPKHVLKLLCQVCAEMRIIRARDGVPYTHTGYKSDVSQEYWDSLISDIDEVVVKETGKTAWLNPLLYED